MPAGSLRLVWMTRRQVIPVYIHLAVAELPQPGGGTRQNVLFYDLKISERCVHDANSNLFINPLSLMLMKARQNEWTFQLTSSIFHIFVLYTSFGFVRPAWLYSSGRFGRPSRHSHWHWSRNDIFVCRRVREWQSGNYSERSGKSHHSVICCLYG